jgi:hypothetical protein
MTVTTTTDTDRPDTPKAFKAPSGANYTVGQRVQHSSGVEGVITGQHPDTGKMVIHWDGQ